MSDKPDEGGGGHGFGRKLAGIFVNIEDDPPSSEATVAPAGARPNQTTSSLPRRPNPGQVDETFRTEVQKGIEQRAPSDALSAFLEQIEALKSDISDVGNLYRVALKTAARLVGKNVGEVTLEIDLALTKRLDAVSQERTVADNELRASEEAELAETTQRLEAIRARVAELRAEIGQLQGEESSLTARQTSVQERTGEARSKLLAACDWWVNFLSTVRGNVSQHLKTAAAPKEGSK